MFVFIELFLANLKFATKVKEPTQAEHFTLIRKYETSKKIHIGDKRSGFFCLAISDEEKSFMALTQSHKLISPS